MGVGKNVIKFLMFSFNFIFFVSAFILLFLPTMYILAAIAIANWRGEGRGFRTFPVFYEIKRKLRNPIFQQT